MSRQRATLVLLWVFGVILPAIVAGLILVRPVVAKELLELLI